MPLYRWNADNLEPVPPTNFEAEQLQERGDLQRLLRDQPDVLEEGLFIVAEEYGEWEDSSRRIDLLALDGSGGLVVIELKRTRSGDHSDLQAIRYAAMVANMTLDDVFDAHRRYLQKRGINEDARMRVLYHLGIEDEENAEVHTERPRIVLASAGFSTELTTSVLWLRDGGMDISCVKLQLYQYDGSLLLDTGKLIPLPEASGYLVKVREREEEEVKQRGRTTDSLGIDAFQRRIADMPEDVQLKVSSLCDWAIGLEKENLVRLQTRRGINNTILRVNLARSNDRLLIAQITKQNGYWIEVWRETWNIHAPNSVTPLEQAIKPGYLREVGSGTYLRNWSKELLGVVRDAYREANGFPPTTPQPGTGPGTPAQAE